MADDPEQIARKLTKAQRRITLETNGLRRLNEVHLQAWGALHTKGIASYVRAAGYTFFDLTPFGLQVRAILDREQRERG